MIDIFATDMDHTLLDDSSNLPSDFQETLNRLKTKNIPLVLASGRSLASMKEKVADIDYDFIFISDNGAIIEKDNKMIHKSPISKDNFEYIVDVIRLCPDTSICVTGLNKAYIEIHGDNHAEFLLEYYPDFEVVTDIKSIKEEVIKVTSLNIEKNDEIYENIVGMKISNEQGLVALKSGKVWIDIMNSNVDKGVALAHVLDVFEISASGLAAFGDYHNDIGMLRLAKYSHAVFNAHEDVKKIADLVIGSNNQSSVTKVINEYLSAK